MARWLVKGIAKYDVITDEEGSYARIFAFDGDDCKWKPRLTCHLSVIVFINKKKENLKLAIEQGLFRVIE